ncbi:DUF2330 domain-containing protein [Pseudenhygromyxa sp. WMMC2535]|uniref:DUF2330 domain-containing protein n=1 Tax=Pseudenhygromyxa sp. WMMC2535 TaxID=2712867 RepID=UPI001555C9EC|nr:DUF2330 domain-containing protein [Pseudenhygromyxa sp. WMMC2535]NVB42561.1 DUF2330 domain-containing protein [Pseudenhygromyxa sp. WMMC2535]
MITRRLLTCLAAPAALALPLLLNPSAASACGGTFCDTGPTSMPVDQTGENILFVIDGNIVEAHIQIQYDPENDAEKFAWVIPMTAVPEFSVGSETLFQNLLAGSVPTYGFNTVQEPCGDSGDDLGESTSTGDDGWGDTGTDDGGDTGGPNVILQQIVGAFEVTVLEGGTVEGVMQWLDANGYQQDPAAEPILGEYLNEGHLFVALKLAFNADVDEIHPIVLRYEGNESCVPLRLTRIAASEDMDIRAFVLANGRAAPTNYRHVIVNPLMIDWINFAENYKEVVSMAVDAFAAEGNAFVTEYAGTSGVVSQAGLYEDSWDAAPFAELQDTPENTIELLESQGLAYCYEGQCELLHPLLPALVESFLPTPDGVEPADFYGCLICYGGLIDEDAWDAAAFSAALDERIIAPGKHAVGLLDSWSYLTRMYTTISPNEMYEDPIFHVNMDLQDVPAIRQGTHRLLCEGGAEFILPDGRSVYMPDPFAWPEISGEMPWEQEVSLAVQAGPNQVLSDRTDTINQLLDAWNAAHGWPPSESGDGDGDGEGGSDEIGDEGDSGGDDSGNDGTGGAGIEDGAASCACSSEGQGEGRVGWGLLGLLGLGLVRRRRTAPRSREV